MYKSEILSKDSTKEIGKPSDLISYLPINNGSEPLIIFPRVGGCLTESMWVQLCGTANIFKLYVWIVIFKLRIIGALNV